MKIINILFISICSLCFVISLILFYFNPIFAVIGLFITPILCQTIQNYRGAVLVGKSK